MSASAEKVHIASTLLSRAHSPSTTDSIFEERVKQRPLLLRPSSPDPAVDARAKRREARQAKEAQQRRSRKPKPLSAKQKRATCTYDIPKDQQKYEIYVPLHNLWCGYMREILGVDAATKSGRPHHVTGASAGPMLTSADYHGAMVEVIRSRCISRVGLKGIVLKDTKFTFEIITKENQLKSETRRLCLRHIHTDTAQQYLKSTPTFDSRCLSVQQVAIKRGHWCLRSLARSSRIGHPIERIRSSSSI